VASRAQLPRITHQALIYESGADFATRRAPFREQHLRLVTEAFARGDLLMAGGLGTPPDGSLLVFRGSSPLAAQIFARADPYVTQGLVTWRVRPWAVVIGPAADDR
jgi:uncharacterized protein YciI